MGKININNKGTQGEGFDDSSLPRFREDLDYSKFLETVTALGFEFCLKLEKLNERLKSVYANNKDMISMAEIFLAMKQLEKRIEAGRKECGRTTQKIAGSLAEGFTTSPLERIPLPNGTVFPKSTTSIKVYDEEKAVDWLREIGAVEHVTATIETEEALNFLVKHDMEGDVSYGLSDTFEKYVLERANFDKDLPDKEVLEVKDFTVVSYRSNN